MRQGDTIVALSSGPVPAGVAIIRLSGPKVRDLLTQLVGLVPTPRQMILRDIQIDGSSVDRGLAVYFPAPSSFTGEDCAELHLHGSPAVVRAVLRHLGAQDLVRLAEAGEFTRRAFENGKLDLSEVDGLGDLIVAETEGQRRQAFERMDGGLARRISAWRETLLDLRAEIEARLDFSDESDVDLTLPEQWNMDLAALRTSLQDALGEADRGRIVRTGFRVALAGLPNAGKSSLLNALVKSDLAIVSSEMGTTRDVREVPLDMDGQLVIFVDMAGLRESDSIAEAEGVRRAEAEIAQADLVLWLCAPDIEDRGTQIDTVKPVWRVQTKQDLGHTDEAAHYSVSSHTGEGLDELTDAISRLAGHWQGDGEVALVSRERDVAAIRDALNQLQIADRRDIEPEVAAEALRQASDSLAHLVGAIDSEQILDQLFSRFCIGK
jgi:tRNA modification GTPase